MTRPSSLTGRVLLGVLALVYVGLLASDAATYLSLQKFLLDRTDVQLHEATHPATAWAYGALVSVGQLPPLPREEGHPPPPIPPFGTYLAVLGPGGETIKEQSMTFGTGTSSGRPVLPRAPPLDPTTVRGTGGAREFRVIARPLPDGSGRMVLVGIPLTEVQDTLARLMILEGAISAVVLVVLGLLAWWTVRIGLRPLERMGATAQAIAAGDLSRRVEPATPRTEIGRLGLALNAMLAQIESAFEVRTRSEQRLRRFVADASHELRTPLTSIRGYAELLRRSAAQSPEDAALARRRIEQEAVRMSVLVDDLLLLARLDQGRPLERVPVDLVTIARDAVADASAIAPQRAVTLEVGSEVVVTGDDLRLRQVLGNLLRNAIVHTPPTSPIEVRVRAEGGAPGQADAPLQDTGRAVVTVTDHGPGLPPDMVERVFEPFYRADPGRSRDRGGSGLGLAIVAAVVTAHGGRVEVDETPGGGATFRVVLPLDGHTDNPAISEVAHMGA